MKKTKVFQRFRPIHWKLALVYAIVTTIAIIITITLLWTVIVFIVNSFAASPTKIREAIYPLPLKITEALTQNNTQSKHYQDWTDSTFQEGDLIVVDDGEEIEEVINSVSILSKDGEVLAQTKKTPDYVSALEDPTFLKQLQELTDLAPQRVDDSVPENKSVVIPIVEEQTLIGFIVFEVSFPEVGSLFSWLPVIGTLSLVIFFLSMILGTGYGYFATRSLVNQIHQLNESADKWAQGLFDTQVDISSNDEIGSLGQNLNQMANQLQTLVSTRQQLSTLAERGRIARELHDTVKQQVFAAQMHLSSARFVIEKNPEQAAEILDTVLQLNEQTQHELVALIHALRPAEFDDQGFINALNTFLTDWGQQTGVTTNLATSVEKEIPLEIEIALYRVAQEALTNIAKHAKANSVEIILTATESNVTMSVCDDGEGFTPSDRKTFGYGLSSMQERIESLSGNLNIISVRGSGCKVVAAIELT